MRFLLIPVLVACAGFVHADQDAPYAGQQQRDIKALSEQEMASYRNGEGMGMARAAELNHYPGPKHVLQLSSELDLSEIQLDQTKTLFEAMQSRASALDAYDRATEFRQALGHLPEIRWPRLKVGSDL